MKKKLPIGIQTFRDIRNPSDNYVYIDKTATALELIQSGRYYFLSQAQAFRQILVFRYSFRDFQRQQAFIRGLRNLR
jgi:hypothetical protein